MTGVQTCALPICFPVTIEKLRWIEGYGSLPGTYYHFLQERVVKDRLTGKTERPLILERDYVLHCEVNQAWKKFQPVFIVKARYCLIYLWRFTGQLHHEGLSRLYLPCNECRPTTYSQTILRSYRDGKLKGYLLRIHPTVKKVDYLKIVRLPPVDHLYLTTKYHCFEFSKIRSPNLFVFQNRRLT